MDLRPQALRLARGGFQHDAVARGDEVREDRERDLGRRARADGEAHGPAQPRDLLRREVEVRRAACAARRWCARSPRRRRRKPRSSGPRAAPCRRASGSCDTVRTTVWPSGRSASHRLVGHAVDPLRALRAPCGAVLLARIADEHLEVHGGRHLGEVMGDLGSADDEHAPARAMHAGEPRGAASALAPGRPRAPGSTRRSRDRRGARRCGPGRSRASSASTCEISGSASMMTSSSPPHGRPKRRASSAVTPYAAKRGARADVLLAARDQVVLDAAAGDRAHEDAVVADRGERARRPRARAEGLRDRQQPHAPALALPVARVLEDVEVEALHCRNVTRGGSRAPKAWERRLPPMKRRFPPINP